MANESHTAEGVPGGIGARLRQWRNERGLSQGALAKRAGVAASTLSRWEAGITTPSVPEWQATLNALGLPAETVHHSLALLAAPRAVRAARNAPTGSVPPPVGGDLLRALRLRRGMTQGEAASLVGVPQNAVARWERSETWPDAGRLHALCFHLGAYPEEVAALTAGRFSLVDLLEARDPDELHQEQWRIRVQPPHAPAAALKDLRFLALEARLHSLLASAETGSRGERLRRILSWTYARHAQYLMETGRVAEAVPPARHAVTLQKSLGGARNDEGWVPAILALAADETRTARAGDRRDTGVFRRGLERLTRHLPHVAAEEYRAWVLSEMARYALAARRGDEAVRYSEEALRSVMESGKDGLTTERRLRRRDYADVLLAAGRPQEAVRFLPLANWSSLADQNVLDLLTRAAVFRALADPEADTALQHARAILDANAVTLPGDTARPAWQTTLRRRADALTGE